jgi:hypothetical protein
MRNIVIVGASKGLGNSMIDGLDGTEAALKKYSNGRIPVADIISIINVVLNSSVATCIKEIHVPALKDTDL